MVDNLNRIRKLSRWNLSNKLIFVYDLRYCINNSSHKSIIFFYGKQNVVLRSISF